MPEIPYLRETPLTQTWTDTEAIVFTATSYTMVGLYATLLVFAGINSKQFFISNSKLMRSSPLLVFYLLILCCLLADMIYSVLIVAIEVNSDPMVMLLPATFKVALGFEQLWIMIELSMRVNCVICAMKAGHNSVEEETTDDVLSGCILCMRRIVMALIFAFLLTVLVWSLIAADSAALDEFVFSISPYVYGAIFAFLCVSLLITTVVLARRLAE